MECPFNKMSCFHDSQQSVSPLASEFPVSFYYYFFSQKLLGDDVHETSRLCTVFTGTGTGAQGTFHPHPRRDFSHVYSCCSLVTWSCLTLFYPMDWTDCPVHGTLQAKILNCVAISSSRGSSWPRDWTHVSCISCTGRGILYHWDTWEAQE